MKNILPLLAVFAAALLGFSALAQNSTTGRFDDDALRKRLIGTWTREDHPDLTNTVTVSFTFRANGTYSNSVTSVVGSLTRSDYHTGNWEIQKGVLNWTVKRTSDAGVVAVGVVKRWTIESLDDRQLVVNNGRNATTRWERMK